jgi:MFS family permease
LPASEGLMPPLAVASIAFFGWRDTWLAGSAFLLVIALPVFLYLLKEERRPTHSGPASNAGFEAPERYQWSRKEVLRSPLFYALLAIVLAPPFIMTAVFFNQVTLSEAKSWSLTWFAASFPLLAGAHVLTTLSCGWLIDRVGARRLLSTLLLPLGSACALLALVDHIYVLPVAMVLIGMTLGGASTTSGALWPELYGTLHLGAIRAATVAAVVMSTAIAPGLVGAALDAGVSLQAQLLAMSGYCFGAAVWTLSLLPKLNRLAESGR